MLREFRRCIQACSPDQETQSVVPHLAPGPGGSANVGNPPCGLALHVSLAAKLAGSAGISCDLDDDSG
jgi:hypothetical protein